MTKKDKEKILIMRSSGKSYAEIAEALALSPNTISSFCRRKLAAPIVKRNNTKCKYCGKEIVKKQGSKTKVFCSPSCCHKWWYKNNNAGKTHKIKCLCCSTIFYSRDRFQKYCSHKCYINHRYRRSGDENE